MVDDREVKEQKRREIYLIITSGGGQTTIPYYGSYIPRMACEKNY